MHDEGKTPSGANDRAGSKEEWFWDVCRAVGIDMPVCMHVGRVVACQVVWPNVNWQSTVSECFIPGVVTTTGVVTHVPTKVVSKLHCNKCR